jgi:hypothetical protein
MPRPPAPCGTYPAYRRHLRKNESVDAACKRAQRDHDANRRSKADDRPVATLQPRPRSLEDLAQGAQAAFIAKLRATLTAAESGRAYEAIDYYCEADRLLEQWCEALDDMDLRKHDSNKEAPHG